MTHLRFEVTKVANGYTIVELHATEQETEGFEVGCHIAATQDEVSKVVKTICRGSFGDPGKEKKE